MNGNYLITTDGWFRAPDGKQYNAVWGYCTVVPATEMLGGISPNRNSANWGVKVGRGDDHIYIAGCQIHYAFRCDEVYAGLCLIPK